MCQHEYASGQLKQVGMKLMARIICDSCGCVLSERDSGHTSASLVARAMGLEHPEQKTPADFAELLSK